MTDVSEILPHQGAMLLLDEIVSSDEESLTARVEIRETSTFFKTDGVPSWVGIEYLAQAVAAWAGKRGGGPQVGFLLGVKKYTATQPVFSLGSTLTIEIRARDKHENLGIFEGRIGSPEASAQGVISVYEGEPPGVTEEKK